MKIKKLKIWFETLRPRTLPLSISSSLMGSFLAFSEKSFSYIVAVLSLLTALFLQILSNLSNDYGDFLKNADLPDRIGPKRGIHTNEITYKEIKKAIILFTILSLLTGIILIYIGTKNVKLYVKLIYLITGIFAIYSAIKYTIGEKPYGYRGMGDLFVFIFFGLIGVIGTYYLHTGKIKFDTILPAISIGLLTTGVLNINNIRDFYHDQKVNKKTLVVLTSIKFSKFYHLIIIITALLTSVVYNHINNASLFQYLFLLTIPFLIKNVYTIFVFKNPAELNLQLKNLSYTTLLFTILFGMGIILK